MERKSRLAYARSKNELVPVIYRAGGILGGAALPVILQVTGVIAPTSGFSLVTVLAGAVGGVLGLVTVYAIRFLWFYAWARIHQDRTELAEHRELVAKLEADVRRLSDGRPRVGRCVPREISWISHLPGVHWFLDVHNEGAAGRFTARYRAKGPAAEARVLHRYTAAWGETMGPSESIPDVQIFHDDFASMKLGFFQRDADGRRKVTLLFAPDGSPPLSGYSASFDPSNEKPPSIEVELWVYSDPELLPPWSCRLAVDLANETITMKEPVGSGP